MIIFQISVFIIFGKYLCIFTIFVVNWTNYIPFGIKQYVAIEGMLAMAFSYYCLRCWLYDWDFGSSFVKLFVRFYSYNNLYKGCAELFRDIINLKIINCYLWVLIAYLIFVVNVLIFEIKLMYRKLTMSLFMVFIFLNFVIMYKFDYVVEFQKEFCLKVTVLFSCEYMEKMYVNLSWTLFKH